VQDDLYGLVMDHIQRGIKSEIYLIWKAYRISIFHPILFFELTGLRASGSMSMYLRFGN